MASVTIRNIPDHTRRALKQRAARNGRSTEAEIRDILEGSVQPKVGLGTALAAIGRSSRGKTVEFPRDPTAVVPAPRSPEKRRLVGSVSFTSTEGAPAITVGGT